ncbi:MAG: hypothetical protein V3T72_05510 [Thermoanaerobaculia bacterium]
MSEALREIFGRGFDVRVQLPAALPRRALDLARRGGSEIPLLLEDDVIELIPGSVIFLDGFETGGVARWSAATPG